MPRKIKLISGCLVLSLCANAYLIHLVMSWQEAWLEQIMTTSNIELLYKESGADISFSSMQETAKEHFKGTYEVVPINESDSISGYADGEALSISGTKLYFKDGEFIGSKANLPEVEYWYLLNEF